MQRLYCTIRYDVQKRFAILRQIAPFLKSNRNNLDRIARHIAHFKSELSNFPIESPTC